MEGKTKKPSLFKQRIAAVKSDIIGASFPKAVKIVSTEPELQLSTSTEEASINVDSKFEKTLVDMIKDQSLLQAEDVNKISQQNWATVQAMSEKQRQDMVKQINSQLNKRFLDKLKKNPIKQQISMNSSSVSQIKDQKKEQAEESQQNNDSWEHSLKINIQTGKICYTEQSKETLVSIAQITQMIGSDNNQSQVIGSNLAKKFVNELISTATAKSRELIIINYVPLHLSIIFERLSYLFFEPMMKRALKTSFVSVFMQIIQIIPQIITKIHKYISKNYRQTFSRQLKQLSETVKTFQNDQQKVHQLITTLDVIYNLIRQNTNKVEDEDWKCMKQHSDILLQLILIEQADKDYFNSYVFNILEFVQKSSDLTEIIEVESFVYEIVNKFLLRKTKQLYLNLNNFRNSWRHIIDIITGKIISKIVNVQLQVIFQLIFLARFVGDSTWERILSSVNHLASIKQMITHFILFNTLSDQKSAGLRQQNLESLNQVFNWLANILSQKSSKLNPTYVTNTLLELFLQEEEYYSELDQSILQKLITSIATNQQTNFDLIFNQEKVKALIKNYGYNSFGNQVFTNLLFFVGIKCPAELQALILREVMVSYSSNFIGSASRLNVDLPAIQGKKKASNQQIKSEIIQSLNKQSEKNLFFTYLSSS